jgi:CheY-like chemotaxis protein
VPPITEHSPPRVLSVAAADLSSVEPAQRPAILVAEGHDEVREMLGLALRRFGLGVHVASNGPEAVEVYGTHGAGIDVVLVDMHLPDLDGPQTLAALRRLDPQVRCCFMGGDTGGYSVADLLALGAAGFVRKPFDLPALARTLRQAAA